MNTPANKKDAFLSVVG